MTPLSWHRPTWSIALLRRPAAEGPPDTGDLIAGASLGGLARSAVRTLRDSGAAAVIRNGLAVAGLRRVVIIHRRADVRHGDARTPPDVNAGVVTEDDLDAYQTLRPDTPLAEAQRRLRAGHICVGAWRGDRLVSVRWFAPDEAKIPYVHLSFMLRPGVRYAYDAFTDPVERRNGLGRIVGDALTRRASAEGAISVISAVLPENRDGMALVPGRGELLGVLGTITVGRRLIVASSVPRGYMADPFAL